jgi:hypothetical protein
LLCDAEAGLAVTLESFNAHPGGYRQLAGQVFGSLLFFGGAEFSLSNPALAGRTGLNERSLIFF